MSRGTPKPRLLLSARDAGSLGHINAILHEAGRHPWLDVRVYADDPAFAELNRAFPFVKRFGVKAAADPSPEHATRLVSEARRIVEAERPDAVLVGVSHFHEVGLDEAFLAAADGRPTFAMQDFWGDANLNLGGADLYFALDEVAVRLTRARHGKAALACGSPKHARYAALDVPTLRATARARLGIRGERRVIGYFGQALSALPGYARTLRAFARALEEAPDAFVFYKPHPREEQRAVEATLACFAAAGRPVPPVHEGCTEEWLAAADVVACCFSSCGYDAAFLNRSSPVPVVAPVYLLFDESIAAYFRSVTELDVPPPAELGIVRSITAEAGLGAELRAALSDGARKEMWRLAREHLPDPRDAAREILQEIGRRVAGANAAGWARGLAALRG